MEKMVRPINTFNMFYTTYKLLIKLRVAAKFEIVIQKC